MNSVAGTVGVNRKSDQTVISSFAIEYRDDDNKSKITREDGTVIEYDYDDQKRLTKEKWTAADQTVLHDFEYTYDAVGNRLTKTYNGVTTDYDYNNLNQLVQESTGGEVTTYGYDREGNTVRKTEASKETLFAWNPENMLTKAAFSDSTPTNEFKYGGDSVRVQKTDSDGTKQYHWDGLHKLLARDGETILRAFVHGEEEIHGVGSLLLAEDDAGDVAYSLEPMGHVAELTDAGQEVVLDLKYDAFGTRPPGEGDPHTGLGFAGREHDDDLGVWGFQARVYAPGTGRFLSADRLGGDRSRYAYARNSPTACVDPTGLRETETPSSSFQLVYNPASGQYKVFDRAHDTRPRYFRSAEEAVAYIHWAGMPPEVRWLYNGKRNVVGQFVHDANLIRKAAEHAQTTSPIVMERFLGWLVAGLASAPEDLVNADYWFREYVKAASDVSGSRVDREKRMIDAGLHLFGPAIWAAGAGSARVGLSKITSSTEALRINQVYANVLTRRGLLTPYTRLFKAGLSDGPTVACVPQKAIARVAARYPEIERLYVVGKPAPGKDLDIVVVGKDGRASATARGGLADDALDRVGREAGFTDTHVIGETYEQAAALRAATQPGNYGQVLINQRNPMKWTRLDGKG